MTTPPKFRLGDRVAKVSGSSWHGVIVGTYSTTLTPEGYAVESEREPGSVQIYPAAALAQAAEDDEARLLREADDLQARIDATIRSLDETRDARRALAALRGEVKPDA